MTIIFSLAPETLDAALERLKTLSSNTSSEELRSLSEVCIKSLQHLRSGHRIEEQLVPYFERKYRESFVGRIREFAQQETQITAGALFWLAFEIYALLKEYQLRSSTFDQTDLLVFSYFDENYGSLSAEQRLRIDYLRGKLPYDVLLENARNLNLEIDAKFVDEKKRLEEQFKKVDQWEKKLDEWRTKVAELQSVLSSQVEGLNFVGLSLAFSQQISRRRIEIMGYGAFLIAFGVLLLVVPATPHFAPKNWELSIAWNLESIPKAAGFAVFELLLLYYFRVLLRNFLSARDQLSRLELRRSLCAFVQSYAEFAQRARSSSDAKTLERFESLVFSDLPHSQSGIPSHLDGIGDVIDLLREMRKNSKA